MDATSYYDREQSWDEEGYGVHIQCPSMKCQIFIIIRIFQEDYRISRAKLDLTRNNHKNWRFSCVHSGSTIGNISSSTNSISRKAKEYPIHPSSTWASLNSK